MTKRPDGYDRLPKRFRQYVERLEDRVSALEKATPTAGRETALKVVDKLHGGDDAYLPDTTCLEFSHVPGAVLRVEACLDGLRVVSQVGRLAVFPEVSNVVVVAAAVDRRTRRG